jgi:two-component system sensor histidine kinase ArlS
MTLLTPYLAYFRFCSNFNIFRFYLGLLIFNGIAYYLFAHYADNNEVAHMVKRSIRIIDSHQKVALLVGTDPNLIEQPIQYRTQPHTEIIHDKGASLIYVHVPIYEENLSAANSQIGMLEIGRNLLKYNDYKQPLIIILTFTSLSILIVSIIGGSYFYTKHLFKPLQHLAGTMEGIHRDGNFQRLPSVVDARSNELDQLVRIFNEMIARLEAHFVLQKQFVMDASHELRTPLTIIESYSNLLRRWGGDDPKLREEAVETIHSEAIRLKGLTTTLLELIVLNPVEDRESWGDYNLTELLASLAQSIQLAFERNMTCTWLPSSEGQSITASTGLTGEDIYLYGSTEKIRQLFIILLDNAIKYSDAAIAIEVQAQTDTVAVRIIDHGIGIPEEELESIFERFYRVDKARNRKTGGIGLGLAIAQSIVKTHHGTIEIASILHTGTTVTVHLPKMDEVTYRVRTQSE